MVWTKTFLRHTISCDQTVTQSFPGGIFKNQPTIFQKLEDIDVFVPHDQRHYPFYCCYDFESILSQNNLPENGEKLSFTSKHIPLSVGIASNMPNFEDPICFVSEGNETVLVQKMVDYMVGISVYLEAKLHILKFFYHFLNKYIPKKCYSLLESDTDFLYFSISRDSLDNCVPQHLKEEYFREKRKYMPADCCDECLNKFIDVKISAGIWTPPSCCQKRNAFDTRVLGLMKTEYEGEKAVALTCKTYFCEGKSKKQVCKGVSIRQNPLILKNTSKHLILHNH